MQVKDELNGHEFESDPAFSSAAYANDGDREPLDFEDIDELPGDPITEEDAWTIISAHFQERGLVGQQLDSFDNFMTATMQVRIPIQYPIVFSPWNCVR